MLWERLSPPLLALLLERGCVSMGHRLCTRSVHGPCTGKVCYTPLNLRLLPWWDQGTTIHEKSVFTSGGLLLPNHLSVVDEVVLLVVHVFLHRPLSRLLHRTSFTGVFSRLWDPLSIIHPSHFDIAIVSFPIREIDGHFIARRKVTTVLVGIFESRASCGNPSKSFALRCQTGMQRVEAVSFFSQASEIDVLIIASERHIEDNSGCRLLRSGIVNATAED